ncbi:MAG: hypothetical protein GKC08_04505 [Methanosarcinales archaeon]|nr:hypothetical protein [Methanosarcinales archaeon]
MKWAANELKKRGKTVHYVDLSNRPELDAIKSVGEVPDGVKNAVIGLTTMEPADVMKQLFEKGVVNTWIHWRTDTPAVRELCAEHRCFTGRCPMMYLGSDLSIHGVHRAIGKLTGKF